MANVAVVACSMCGREILRQRRPSHKYVCGSECRSRMQIEASAKIHPRPVSDEWLRSKYLDEGMDCTKISRIVGRDPKTVWKWIRDMGVPTRKRGTTGNHIHSIGVPRKLSPQGRLTLSINAREARKRDGRIPALINGVHWMKALGRRPGGWKGGVSPERQALYSTQEWRECVKAVWLRDDAKCQHCGLDNRTILRNTIRFHLHHIDSFAIKETRADPDNIVLLCEHCHRWVHGKSNRKRKYLGKSH